MSATLSDVPAFLLQGQDPDRTALEFLSGSHTYGELRDLVDRVARAVLAMGGEKGDRVLLIGENSLFWVSAYLGVMRAGRVVVPLSPDTSGETLGNLLRTTGAKIVFANRSTARREEKRLTGVRVVTHTRIPVSGTESVSRFPPIAPDDLAALMFTSGSTAEPRGVMVSHRNIIANTESIIGFLGLTEADRMMVVLPFHYCFGASLLHTHLRVGGALVVDSRFMYPEVVLQRMIDARCTGFAGVPSHFQILLGRSGLATRRPPSLRYVQQAGGRLAPEEILRLRRALPGTTVFVMYGQTEATARLSYLPPEHLDAKAGSIGKGMPGVGLRVVDESGRDIRPGETGEIVAAGESVACGYWGSPKESAESFRDGVLHTGDIATVDEDGFIYIVDRAREFLKIGGERVSSRRIEENLLKCDELLEACVIGIPDETLGEAVKAFVVPRSPGSGGLAARVESYCRERMPPPLVPREVVVLERLPKNSAGKVVKARLRTLETMTRP